MKRLSRLTATSIRVKRYSWTCRACGYSLKSVVDIPWNCPNCDEPQ